MVIFHSYVKLPEGISFIIFRSLDFFFEPLKFLGYLMLFPDVSLRNISPSHLQISAVSLILLVFFSTLRGNHADSVMQVGLLAPKEKLEGIDIAPDTRMHEF